MPKALDRYAEPLSHYPGQRSYAESSDWFAARHAEAAEVAAAWHGNQLTVLTGSSGVGKSSLLAAGVIPVLTGPDVEVLPVGQMIGRAVFPTAALADHNRLVLALLSSWAPTESAARLSRMTIQGFLRQRLIHSKTARMLISVDQGEVIFKDTFAGNRGQFLDQLSEALHEYPQVHALIVARDDCLGDILADHRLSGAETVRLIPLSRAAAIEAVRRPAAVAGRPFRGTAAEALVDQLVEYPLASESRASPAQNLAEVQPVVLQVACAAVWNAVPAGQAITRAKVLSTAVTEQALATFAASRIAVAARYAAVQPSMLYNWLVPLLTTDSGRRASPEPAESSGDRIPRREIMMLLEDQHLLRVELRDNTRWYSLLSEHMVGALRRAAYVRPADAQALAAATPAQLMTHAAQALSNGATRAADRLAGEVLSSAPAGSFRLRAQAEMLLGNVAFQHGRTDQTRRHYLAAAEFFEAAQDRLEVGRLLAAVGRVHLLEWDATAAVSTLHSAATRLPADGAVMLDLARAFADSGQAQAAVAALSSAISADAGVGAEDARLLRADILADLGDATGALRELDSVPNTQPLAARAARALSLARLGQIEDADEGIGQALETGHDNGPVLLRAAQIRALRGDASGAEHYLRQAMKATRPRLSQYQRRQADSLKLGKAV